MNVHTDAQYVPLSKVAHDSLVPKRHFLLAGGFYPGFMIRQANTNLVDISRIGLVYCVKQDDLIKGGFIVSPYFDKSILGRFSLKGMQRVLNDPHKWMFCELVYYLQDVANSRALKKPKIKGASLHRQSIDYSRNGNPKKVYSSAQVRKEISTNLKLVNDLIIQHSTDYIKADVHVDQRTYQTSSIEQIWEQFHRTHDDRYRNLLMENYRNIVRYVAERLHRKLPDKVELDDLISAGIFGLMDAIDAFDPNRGVKFETYCSPRIKGSILDELRSMDWVPRLVRARAHQLSRATHSLEGFLSREPSDEEIAEELNMDMEAFNRLQRDAKAASLISLDTKFNDGDSEKDLHEIDVIPDIRSEDPLIRAQKYDLKNLLIKGLTRAEKLIVVLYYYEEMTMKEIGNVLDLCESRVSQLHSSIIARLKAQMFSKREQLGLGESGPQSGPQNGPQSGPQNLLLLNMYRFTT